MKNIVPQTMAALSNSADLIRFGLKKYQAALKLYYADLEQVEVKQEAFRVANGNYQQVKFQYAEHRILVLQLTKEARGLAMMVRELLKPILGPRYSRVWDGTGFKNSLETPRSLAELKPMILSMSLHLDQYSATDNPPLAYMAGKAKTLHERMKDAFVRLNLLEGDLAILFEKRAETMQELRRYLRVVIDELHLALSPLDVRWMDFGLNLPGRKETPPAPEKVEVKVIDNKRAEVKWPSPPRAEYFRVWVKVVGVDAEPRAVGSPSDPDFMFEELPERSTLEIFVSAVNSGGESSLSEPVVITTV